MMLWTTSPAPPEPRVSSAFHINTDDFLDKLSFCCFVVVVFLSNLQVSDLRNSPDTDLFSFLGLCTSDPCIQKVEVLFHNFC